MSFLLQISVSCYMEINSSPLLSFRDMLPVFLPNSKVIDIIWVVLFSFGVKILFE